MDKLINDKTAIGKGGKVALWSALSVLFVGVLSSIVQNPQFFSWKSGLLVVVANVGLVLIKNFTDPNVRNY